MTFVLLILSLTLLVFVVEFLEIQSLAYFAHLVVPPGARFTFYLVAWLITFLITTIYAAVFFFLQWHHNKLKAEVHERMSIEARYEVLRNQVNPHFLFNSFNTLSGMVDPNSTVSHYVQNLSDFFRYVLSVSNRDLVNLEEELIFAKNYAYIQEQRFSGKLHVSFEIPPKFLEKQLPPLSLQMLLENAIKHNEISMDHPLEVKIYEGKENSLIIRNQVVLKESLPVSNGLGLQNIRERYAFLSEKNIQIRQDNGFFEVELPLL